MRARKLGLDVVRVLLCLGISAAYAVVPATPSNPSPGTTSSPGPVLSSSSVTLSWSTVSGATYYDFGVTDINAGMLVVDTTSSGTSYTANLAAGKPYRWNVRACNASGCSGFTSLLYFQTPGATPTVPATPSNPSPGTTSSPGPVLSSSSVTLSWSAVSGATYYDFGVTDINAGMLVVDTTSSGTSYTANLAAGKPYRWNVRACNASGCSGFTSLLYFQTPSLPILSVNPASTFVSAAGGSASIDVTNVGSGTFTYSATIASDSNWLTINSGGSGGNSGTIKLSYAANAGAQRTGTIVVTASGLAGSATITVVQASPFNNSNFNVEDRIMAGAPGAAAAATTPGASPAPILVRNASLDQVLFQQTVGVHGTIKGGPVQGTAGGFTGNWWQISWDSEPPEQHGIPGWSAESVISSAPSTGDVRPQPDLATSPHYTHDNIFWQNGWAPASTNPRNLQPDMRNLLGNCTWYAHGRLRELGYDATKLGILSRNANEWGTLAPANWVDNTPAVGSIAQWDGGKFGHVAVVESVNADGTITVTESSATGADTPGSSTWNFLWRHRTIHPSWFSHFIHVDRIAIVPNALSGLWWNPSESGWGVSFTQRGDIVFAAWYTYDETGNPVWYVASNCAMSSSGTCNGSLYEVNGPTFFGVDFSPAAANLVTVGTLRVAFQNTTNATMTYTVNGQGRTLPITRQIFQAGTAAPSIDYTDLWWNPSESGWGISITQQHGTMFLAWYVYDNAGKPVWYVASNCAVNGNGCSGKLYRTTGPAFGPTFNSAQVQMIEVGTVNLNFIDANNGTLSYMVSGVAASKSITRQLFSAAPGLPQPISGALVTSRGGGFFDSSYNSGVADSNQWRQHLGTDYQASANTEVRAIAAGTVVYCQTTLNDPFNSAVIVQQPNSTQLVYGHIFSTLTMNLVTGNCGSVRQGQALGYVQPASSSNSNYQPHLHLGYNVIGLALPANLQNGTWGWGRAPYSTTRTQAEARGWRDVNDFYHAPMQ